MKVNKADEFYKILERKAIYPVFQPIVNLQTGRVSGYEALSRIDRSSTTLTISDLFGTSYGSHEISLIYTIPQKPRGTSKASWASPPVSCPLF